MGQDREKHIVMYRYTSTVGIQIIPSVHTVMVKICATRTRIANRTKVMSKIWKINSDDSRQIFFGGAMWMGVGAV